ncbi:hypothetical protein N8T08_005166 [Aspergillus melleus]|uniref:Uncharacterized protein n=1 Tax=Aspergillus melleus TaxID=138277 RepID=A0ACC3BFW1_9EURO|nr:hypothetical protein N8T08_005166 [Aspergillus melleus]
MFSMDLVRFAVPVSVFALIMGRIMIPVRNVSVADASNRGLRGVWKQVDLSGALLLILGLSIQLVGLSLGGNELPWSNTWVVASLVASVVLLVAFLVVEARTTAIPVIPLRMLQGMLPLSTQIANVCVGMAAYAFLFMLPLFFQVILLDSASKAGARLVIPSLATPIGGLISGIIMSRWGKLAHLVRAGAFLMFIGNVLVMLLDFDDARWKYFVYVVPANLGQGIVYPAILFTFLAAFDHSDHAVSASTVYLIRSLGTVWGVAITSTILQNHLNAGLPDALSGVPDKWKVISEIRHSVSAIYTLPPDIQAAAREVYYGGIQMAFGASAVFGGVASLAAVFLPSLVALYRGALIGPRQERLVAGQLNSRHQPQIRLVIYEFATPPRVVRIKEVAEDKDEFLRNLNTIAFERRLCPSLTHFAHHWRYYIPENFRQPTLEGFGFTDARPRYQPWEPSDATPEIGIKWLAEQPKLAWEMLRESYMYIYTSIPELLHVCRESCKELESLGYELAFRTRLHGPRTWFNFNHDVVYISRVRKGLQVSEGDLILSDNMIYDGPLGMLPKYLKPISNISNTWEAVSATLDTDKISSSENLPQ